EIGELQSSIEHRVTGIITVHGGGYQVLPVCPLVLSVWFTVDLSARNRHRLKPSLRRVRAPRHSTKQRSKPACDFRNSENHTPGRCQTVIACPRSEISGAPP